jgi:hypothetical protein
MIQSKDLMLGNWVMDNNGKVFQWEQFHWYQLNAGIFGLEDIHPIPLTDEILDKCKFRFIELDLDDLSIRKTFNTFYFVIGNYAQCLEYLHQLQNLYNFFCKKELKITF